MVKYLRNEGHVVNIISLEGTGGDFPLHLKGNANLLKILKYALFYDRIVIQYHESFYYDDQNKKNIISILMTHFSFYLIFLMLRQKLEVDLHEFPRSHSSAMTYHLEKMKWRICPNFVFHTQKEIDDFANYFNLPKKSYELRSPNAYFYKFRDISQKEAREELGIPNNAMVCLCIGFIQPHKGYDRAAQAFKSVNNEKMHLYIVGSLRIQWDIYVDYLEKLKNTAAENSQIHVVERYLSDEDFDTWIIACDVMVIPYREIWSSGVLGRAKLFNKKVIASNVGGLAEQLEENDILFSEDEELKEIFSEFSSVMSNEALVITTSSIASIIKEQS